MKDTIKRSDAIKVLEKCRHRLEGNGSTYQIMLEMMENIPSAEKQGKWDYVDNGLLSYAPFHRCKACGDEMYTTRDNFCPNCGARMKGADDE